MSSALQVIDDLIARVIACGIPAERIVLLGFSQGACLTLEYAARHAQRYGGIVGLSGGLIGPPGAPRSYAGSFSWHADLPRLQRRRFSHPARSSARNDARCCARLGGEVTERIYPGMDHTINQDEIDFVNGLMTEVLRAK